MRVMDFEGGKVLPGMRRTDTNQTEMEKSWKKGSCIGDS
jgi:hypothetical protein